MQRFLLDDAEPSCLLDAVHSEFLQQGVSCKGGFSRPIPVVRVISKQQE